MPESSHTRRFLSVCLSDLYMPSSGTVPTLTLSTSSKKGWRSASATWFGLGLGLGLGFGLGLGLELELGLGLGFG